MALFLNESYAKQKNFQTFEEVLFEGLQLSYEYNSLNEAIFQADHIIDGQRTTLSESAFQNLQEGFVGNVWEKVKGYAVKAWEWIKKFWEKVKNKTIEMYNRIKERISGDGLDISKSAIKKLEVKIKACDYGHSVISKATKQSDTASAVKYFQSVNAQFNKFEAELKDADKLTGTQKVSPTFIAKLQSSVNSISSAIEAAAKEAEGKLSEMESKFKASADKANAVAAGSMDTDEKSSHIALLKSIVTGVREIVTELAGVVNASPGAFVGPNKPTNGPERPDVAVA